MSCLPPPASPVAPHLADSAPLCSTSRGSPGSAKYTLRWVALRCTGPLIHVALNLLHVHLLPNILLFSLQCQNKNLSSTLCQRKGLNVPESWNLTWWTHVAVQQQQFRCKQLHWNVAQRRRVEACKAGNREHWSETQLLRYPLTLPILTPPLYDTILSLRWALFFLFVDNNLPTRSFSSYFLHPAFWTLAFGHDIVKALLNPWLAGLRQRYVGLRRLCCSLQPDRATNLLQSQSLPPLIPTPTLRFHLTQPIEDIPASSANWPHGTHLCRLVPMSPTFSSRNRVVGWTILKLRSRSEVSLVLKLESWVIFRSANGGKLDIWQRVDFYAAKRHLAPDYKVES